MAMNKTASSKLHTRKFLVLIILVSSFFMQGCIEIVEDIHINQNLSGTLSLSVNADGGSNIFMALLGQYADLSLMDEIRSNAVMAKDRLRNQKGISNVSFSGSPRKGSLQLSFDFEDDKALNEALYAIADYEKPFWQGKIYKINQHKFVRKNTTPWIKLLLEQEKENIPDDVLFDLIELKTLVHIPAKAKKINKRCNAIATDGDRTFATSNILSDVLDEKRNTRIKIRY
jgi:hypothetical protein